MRIAVCTQHQEMIGRKVAKMKSVNKGHINSLSFFLPHWTPLSSSFFHGDTCNMAVCMSKMCDLNIMIYVWSVTFHLQQRVWGGPISKASPSQTQRDTTDINSRITLFIYLFNQISSLPSPQKFTESDNSLVEDRDGNKSRTYTIIHLFRFMSPFLPKSSGWYGIPPPFYLQNNPVKRISLRKMTYVSRPSNKIHGRVDIWTQVFDVYIIGLPSLTWLLAENSKAFSPQSYAYMKKWQHPEVT